MESRDQRIMTLATTLKSSGIAKTDSQARMMAEEMIGVEEHVQKNYEEEHEKAHEYLQTAKNLRVPRPTATLESNNINYQNKKDSSFSKTIEPLATKPQPYRTDSIKTSTTNDKDNEDIRILTFGTKKEDSTHNTHNSALEAIKSQIQKGDMMPVRDDEDTIIKSIEPEETENKNKITDDEDTIIKSIEPEETKSDIVDNTADTSSTITNTSNNDAKEVVIDEKIDSKKLVELMEEDGKMEEHTREIKEPPKEVKPKEEYAENSIDLSNVFNFNKK